MKKKLISLAIAFLIVVFNNSSVVYAGPHGGGEFPPSQPPIQLSITIEI